jgi:hypothetical protein
VIVINTLVQMVLNGVGLERMVTDVDAHVPLKEKF